MKCPLVKKFERSKLPILFGSIIGIFLGLFVSILFVVNPTPEYEDMQEATVTVESIRYVSSYRGGGHYELKTLDGYRYNLAGDFDASDLQERLPEGTEIQIKYYSKNWLGKQTRYIEEIEYNNERISTYTNDDQNFMIAGFILGGICVAMGIGGIFAYRHFVLKEIVKPPKKYRKS